MLRRNVVFIWPFKELVCAEVVLDSPYDISVLPFIIPSPLAKVQFISD